MEKLVTYLLMLGSIHPDMILHRSLKMQSGYFLQITPRLALSTVNIRRFLDKWGTVSQAKIIAIVECTVCHFHSGYLE